MFLRVAEILWQNSFLVGKSWPSCKHDRFEKSSGQWKCLIKRPHRDSKFGDLVYLKNVTTISIQREIIGTCQPHWGRPISGPSVCHG